MNFKKSSLALAIIGGAMLGFNQEVNAGVYAASSLNLSNLQITIGGLDPIAAPTAIKSFQFTTTNSATLNGVSSFQTATCGGLPSPGVNNCGGSPVLNALVANAPGGTAVLGENTFSLLGPSANQYAVADSVINTAQLVDGVPTSTNQTAQSELQVTGTASSNAEIQSNTGFTLAFTVSGGAGSTFALSFNADPYLRAAITSLGFLNGNAQANLNTSFTLTQDLTGNQVRWTPQGTAGNDCSSSIVGVTCSETADAIDLNANSGVSSNGSNDEKFAGAVLGAFGFNASGLSDGDYTLVLNANTSTNIRLTTVPEPSIIALLGIGLLGMGFSATRKEA